MDKYGYRFSFGPWNIHEGDTAVEAAGTIHSDLSRGFIRAECFSYDDLIAYGSEKPLDFATGGGEGLWHDSCQFLSPEHVCNWTCPYPEATIEAGRDYGLSGMGVFCYGYGEVDSVNDLTLSKLANKGTVPFC